MSGESFPRIELLTKIIGAVGVIVGIFYTAAQIRQSNVNDTADLVYSIQKDGRGVLQAAFDNDDFVKCVVSNETCQPAETSRSEGSIRYILQFYSSVRNQKELGTLPESYWAVWGNELCGFARLGAVRTYWARAGGQPGYGEAFRAEVEKCPG